MPDFTAMELPEAAVPAPLTTTFIDDLREFAAGALLTAAVVAVGAVLVTVALTVGVVAAPLLVAGIAYVVIRRRRLGRLLGTRSP